MSENQSENRDSEAAPSCTWCTNPETGKRYFREDAGSCGRWDLRPFACTRQAGHEGPCVACGEETHVIASTDAELWPEWVIEAGAIKPCTVDLASDEEG